MKKRPLLYSTLAAAAMLSLGVGASMASGGSGGGGGTGGGGTGGGGGGTTATASTSVDLQLTAKASTGSPAPGTSYSFSFTVKNSGSGPADNVVFTDEFPMNAGEIQWTTLNGATLNPCTQNGISPTQGGTILKCPLGSLAKGTSSTVTVALLAPQAADTVTDSGSVASSTDDPNLANNGATTSITVKASTTSLCKGGTCDAVPTVQAAPCGAFTAVSAPVGYYLTFAAIWNDFTIQSCSSSSETVSVQVQELNQLTGAIDYDVTWSVTLSPSQNFSMVLDNDFAPFDTPYTITYTVRDSSGNQLDQSTIATRTPLPQ